MTRHFFQGFKVKSIKKEGKLPKNFTVFSKEGKANIFKLEKDWDNYLTKIFFVRNAFNNTSIEKFLINGTFVLEVQGEETPLLWNKEQGIPGIAWEPQEKILLDDTFLKINFQFHGDPSSIKINDKDSIRIHAVVSREKQE